MNRWLLDLGRRWFDLGLQDRQVLRLACRLVLQLGQQLVDRQQGLQLELLIHQRVVQVLERLLALLVLQALP